MSSPWTSERVMALAPDDSSAKAGRELATPGRWAALGGEGAALWGLCKGSGSKPYQVQIDTAEPAFKCSCPSRKFPCKHALGLFLIAVSTPDALKETDPPEWVKQWLASRAGRAEKKAEKQEAAAAPVDEAARAKRLEQRNKKVTAGMAELETWLRDLVRQGLAGAQGQGYSFWEARAARLVDAQAGGAARLVREMGEIAAAGEDWQGRLLDRAARLYLLAQAWRRLEGLPEAVQADVRAAVGFTERQEELMTREGVKDRWDVLGQRVEVEDKLRAQRTWLRGRLTGRFALVFSFAYGTAPLDMSLLPGQALAAEVVFFPGTGGRAAVKARGMESRPIERIVGHATLAAAMVSAAAMLAANPWVERHPFALEAVTPVLEGGRWWLVDGEGARLPVRARFSQGYRLAALSGGRAIGVFGEWDGRGLCPMSACAESAVGNGRSAVTEGSGFGVQGSGVNISSERFDAPTKPRQSAARRSAAPDAGSRVDEAPSAESRCGAGVSPAVNGATARPGSAEFLFLGNGEQGGI